MFELFIIDKIKNIMTEEGIKQMMNGCEVISLAYEGCVAVINGEAWMDGEKIKVSWSTLWQEYVEGEGF
jgi:hypothetical protein